MVKLIGKVAATVAGGDDPKQADVEQANTTLNEGLKSCRSVVENYREMLGAKREGEAIAAREDPAADPGTPDS